MRLAVAEAAGDGMATGRHAAAITGGTPGILHGSRSLMLQDRDGQVVEAHSASAGLDYPGVGSPAGGAGRGGSAGGRLGDGRGGGRGHEDRDPDARGSCRRSRRRTRWRALPKLLAGLEGSGAPYADQALVLLCFSGRGDKDLAALERFADVAPWPGLR